MTFFQVEKELTDRIHNLIEQRREHAAVTPRGNNWLDIEREYTRDIENLRTALACLQRAAW